MSIRTVAVALKAEVAGYMASLKTAAGATRDFGKELEAAAKADKLDKLARNMAIAGGGMIALAGYAVKLGMDFEAGMSRVGAATGATGKELADLRNLALETGKATQFSATEAAQGITELGKAGIGTKDILGGGLKGALSLAAAGEMGVGEAAETAAAAMTVFKLSGKDIPHIADLLAAGANEARGEVHDMGMALNQSGLVAAQFGISIEDTVAGLTEFAAAGLLGSDAGTSFKTMLLALANPTVQSATLMRDLGIKAFDTGGKFVGLGALSEQLKTQLGGLTQAQRTQALGQIFGNDAIRAASILYEQGAKGLEEYRRKVDVSGSAAETAAKKTDNLKGDLERLRGSLETVAIQAGSGTNTGLRVLTQAVEGLVDGFSSLPPAVQTTVTVLTAVAGSALLAGAGFIKTKSTVAELAESLAGMGPTGTKAARGLEAIAGFAGKAGLVGVGFFAAYEGIKLLTEWLGKTAPPAVRDLDSLATALKEFSSSGKVTGELAKTFGSNLQGLGKDIGAVVKYQEAMAGASAGLRKDVETFDIGNKATMHMQALYRASLQGAENIKALDKDLAATASNGGAGQASVMFERLARGAGLTGAQIEQLKSQMPEFSNAMQNAALANTGLAKGFGDTTTNAGLMASGLELAIQSGKSMIDVWNQLNGAVAGTDAAMLKALESIDKVKDSFDKNGDTIDRNTAAGLRNRVALEDASKVASEVAQRKLEETGSVKAANDAWNAVIDPLKKALHQYHLTDVQLKEINDTILGMAPYKEVPIATPGATQSKTELQSLNEQIQALKDKQVQISESGAVDAGKRVNILQQQIDALHGRTVQINTQLFEQRNYSSGSEFSATHGQRWGGAYEHAAVGKLRVAAMYSVANPGRYMIAEPSTGGEAFIPKHGNYGRSMDILSRAAGWYGAHVMPAGGGGQVVNVGGVTINAPVGSSATEIGATVVRVIKKYEESNGSGWRL